MKKQLVLAFFVMVIALFALSAAASAEAPGITVSAPSIDYAVNGDTIEYEVTYSGDIGAINLTNGHIGLYGFSGHVEISGEGATRTITISDIDIDTEFDEQGEGEIYITINAGSAIGEDGELANGVKSEPVRVFNHIVMYLARRDEVVDEGGTQILRASYYPPYNGEIIAILLDPRDIGLHGFTGNVYVDKTDMHNVYITVTDILGAEDDCFITIGARTGVDNFGNGANAASSYYFKINKTDKLILTAGKPYGSPDGRSVCLDLTYTGDMAECLLDTYDVGLQGLTGDISISGEGNTRTVSITNIKVTDDLLYITINGGTAIDSNGNYVNEYKTHKFTLGDRMNLNGEAAEPNPATGVSDAGMVIVALMAAVIAIASRKKK